MNTAIQGSILSRVAPAMVGLLLVALLGGPLVPAQWLGGVLTDRFDGVSRITGNVQDVFMARGSRWSMRWR